MSHEASSITIESDYPLNFEVAIICLNAERIIQNTIQCLRRVIPNNVSILVVDDGSSDSTFSILENCEVRIVKHPKNLGRYQARQSALSNSEADILVFLDDDCVVDQDWFINLKKAWSSQDSYTVAIGGPVRFREPLNYWGRYYERINPFSPNANLRKVASPVFTRRLLTGNISFKLERLRESSISFNTKVPKHLGGEDVVFCDEIVKYFGSKALLFDPSIVAKLSGNISFREVRDRWIQNAKTEIPIRYSFSPIGFQAKLKLVATLIFGFSAVAGLPFLLNLGQLITTAFTGYLLLLLSRRKFIMNSILPALSREKRTQRRWFLDRKKILLFIELFGITNLGLIFSLYGKTKAYLEILNKPSDYFLIEKFK
jgi:glycosyltransferase involved in cell wall biosynthesis